MSREHRDESSSRLPYNFDSWPREEQVDIDRDIDEIYEDSRLTKKEPAEIHLAIQANSHDE